MLPHIGVQAMFCNIDAVHGDAVMQINSQYKALQNCLQINIYYIVDLYAN